MFFVSDFVWDVYIKDYGIAKGTEMAGERRLRKTSSAVGILKRTSERTIQSFISRDIRRSGFANRFVLFEIGRSHSLGPGELWIEAVNSRSAEDIYIVLFG